MSFVFCFIFTVIFGSCLLYPTNALKFSKLGIIGGTPTAIQKHPYTAAVTLDKYILGAGAIIGRQWIVMSAFQIAGYNLQNITIRVGSKYYDNGGQLLTVDKWIVHTKYDNELDYNIALARTKKRIKFNGKVKAVKIANKKPEEGSHAVLTGWGSRGSIKYPGIKVNSTQQLEMAQVDISSFTDCNDLYTSKLTNRNICAFRKNVIPCSADYGDPLVQNKKLVGFFIGGYTCVQKDFPLVYTNIANLNKWIRKTINNNRK